MDRLPIGIIGNDALAVALASRIASAGHRAVIALGAQPPHLKKTPGIEIASTATDVAFECATVVLAIEDSQELRRIVIGTADKIGIGAEMQPGSILIDTGARPPRETQALFGMVGMRGISYVDAALIGWTEHGPGQDALVLTGGFPDAVNAAEVTLALFGKVERTGPLGSAHTAAALMGYMEAAHSVAEAEAQSVGRALGLGHAAMHRVFDRPSVARNVTKLARHTGILRRIAEDRGLNAEVIDFTLRKLASDAAKTG